MSFRPLDRVSAFRQIAAGMWRHPSDPTIYGSMDVDVTETLAFIDRFRRETGKKVTMTHVVGRAVAQAFARNSDLNAKVRFWGKLEQRTSVDLFVSVSTEGGRDLSGVRFDDADRASLGEWVDAVEARSRGIRNREDPTYERSRSVFRGIPWWMARPALWLTDVLSNELNLDLPSLGMPRDPFGTAVVTNVGMFGIDTAFAPFLPIARCPMLLLITEVRDRPTVVGKAVVPRPTLRLCASFDHRIIDGVAAGRLAAEIRRLVEDPAADEAARWAA
jgi:pyruvate dehydrogenase E2 component (dihydrolipoamide acetyltransferase)